MAIGTNFLSPVTKNRATGTHSYTQTDIHSYTHTETHSIGIQTDSYTHSIDTHSTNLKSYVNTKLPQRCILTIT